MELLQAARSGGRGAAAGGAAAKPETAPAWPQGSEALGARAAVPAFPVLAGDTPPGLAQPAAAAPAASGDGALAAALADLAGAIGQKRGHKSSTIQIKPNYSLPTLGDGDFDVDSFVEEFEEMVGLANDGSGMSAVEMIRVLGTCLKGSRQRAYRVELKQARRSGRLVGDPDDVYL